MSFLTKIQGEIDDYINKDVEISEDYRFSQYKLIKRLALYEAQCYPKGKIDSSGDFKYWYDITSPRVMSEIKNIDFDTSDITLYSTSKSDALPVLLSNIYLQKWLGDNQKAEELNSAVEEFSAWGNVVWKKVKGGYEMADLKNFYVLNQAAKDLSESDVIERHVMTQSELRDKQGVWQNVDDVIATCGNKFFTVKEKTGEYETTNPYYEIFERNGEISEADYNELKGLEGGNANKYYLAKVVVAGVNKTTPSKVLFCEYISEKPYKEAHRGKYKGRWFREGLVEILFDCQTRSNAIGNQIAKGLEWASKTLFRYSDALIVQNALTDLRNGDMIKSKDLAQVNVRMEGLDQLIADWDRNLRTADALANSYEVVTGESLPSGTPFRLGAMQNQNANKLFDFLREKLAISLEEVIQSWMLPTIIKDLKTETIIELTGEEEHIKDYYNVLVNAWYINNLINFPPHSPEEAVNLKKLKLEEVARNKKSSVKIEKGFWDSFKPRVRVVISGENVKLMAELESFYSFIQLEADPTRRTALIEMAMAKKGIDISLLPKSPPQPTQTPQTQAATQPETIRQNTIAQNAR